MRRLPETPDMQRSRSGRTSRHQDACRLETRPFARVKYLTASVRAWPFMMTTSTLSKTATA
eukprot:3381336-Pleurochrysis_carterae.AAC.1